MFYLTSKFHDNGVNTFGFMEGGLLKSPPPLPPGPGTPKKSRRNELRLKQKNVSLNGFQILSRGRRWCSYAVSFLWREAWLFRCRSVRLSLRHTQQGLGTKVGRGVFWKSLGNLSFLVAYGSAKLQRGHPYYHSQVRADMQVDWTQALAARM